ncbi:MAG: hypothetical protein PHX25_00360 [Candidatus Pacebacteria bacterium]|nr:hypothetical protein [Candidatus Paceibacterota bacterium]
MSVLTCMILSGELSSSDITKAIELSDYNKETIIAGLETNQLSTRQMLKILKGVEERVFQGKDEISQKIVAKISFKGLSWEKKIGMIPEHKHNIPLTRRIVRSILWKNLSQKNLEKAVKLSHYNHFVLIAAIETGKLTNQTKFEAIKKVSGNGKDRPRITDAVIRMNHWGEMSVIDCCVAITLSGGNRKIAESVKDHIDFKKMSLETILKVIELSGRHIVIMDAVGKEMDRRGLRK